MRLFALTLLFLSACQSAPPSQRCDLSALPPTEWHRCTNQTVRLQGRRPSAPLLAQHPLLAEPPGLSPHALTEQDYLVAAGNEITVILLLARPLSCSASMSVTGTLQRIDLGGPPRSKTSYKGWVLRVTRATCLEPASKIMNHAPLGLKMLPKAARAALIA